MGLPRRGQGEAFFPTFFFVFGRQRVLVSDSTTIFSLERLWQRRLLLFSVALPSFGSVVVVRLGCRRHRGRDRQAAPLSSLGPFIFVLPFFPHSFFSSLFVISFVSCQGDEGVVGRIRFSVRMVGGACVVVSRRSHGTKTSFCWDHVFLFFDLWFSQTCAIVPSPPLLFARSSRGASRVCWVS